MRLRLALVLRWGWHLDEVNVTLVCTAAPVRVHWKGAVLGRERGWGGGGQCQHAWPVKAER